MQDTLENKQHWIQPPRSAEVANFLYFICNRRLGFFNNSSDKINFWGACLRERSPLSTLLMAWLRLSSYDILVFEYILLDCRIWTLRIWLLYDDSGRFSHGISILTRKCRSGPYFTKEIIDNSSSLSWYFTSFMHWIGGASATLAWWIINDGLWWNRALVLHWKWMVKINAIIDSSLCYSS